mmetsp:Transcript_13814/g.51538  ORF Transcript_13814/g.51538 Transcript_13814/m.51538 type:complete len:313 (-) Transcript_13814:101-1039(-)
MGALKREMSCGTKAQTSRILFALTENISWSLMKMRPRSAFCSCKSNLRMVDFPQPDGPTKAAVCPCGMEKLSDSKILRPRGYWKATSSKRISGGESNFASPTLPLPSGSRYRSGRSSLSGMAGFTDVSSNIASMSMSACRNSLYVDPMKLRGKDSWKRRPLTSTRSPTEAVPEAISRAHSAMMAVRPRLKMTFWPKFRRLSDVCVRIIAFSYCASTSSYFFCSKSPPLCVLMLSMFMSMSITLPFAWLSRSFISRRIRLRHVVTRMVYTTYAAMVLRTTPVYAAPKLCARMAETRPISKTVGTTLNTMLVSR